MAYADIVDYVARFGEPVDEVQIATLLEDVESLVREFVGDRFDDDVPGWLVTLVCGAAHRATQPWAADGVRSEGIDTYTTTYSSSAGTALFLTDDEVAALRGPVIA